MSSNPRLSLILRLLHRINICPLLLFLVHWLLSLSILPLQTLLPVVHNRPSIRPPTPMLQAGNPVLYFQPCPYHLPHPLIHTSQDLPDIRLVTVEIGDSRVRLSQLRAWS